MGEKNSSFMTVCQYKITDAFIVHALKMFWKKEHTVWKIRTFCRTSLATEECCLLGNLCRMFKCGLRLWAITHTHTHTGSQSSTNGAVSVTLPRTPPQLNETTCWVGERWLVSHMLLLVSYNMLWRRTCIHSDASESWIYYQMVSIGTTSTGACTVDIWCGLVFCKETFIELLWKESPVPGLRKSQM